MFWRIMFAVMTIVCCQGCSDDMIQEPVERVELYGTRSEIEEEGDSTLRVHFESEDALLNAVQSHSSEDEVSLAADIPVITVKSSVPGKFIGMMDQTKDLDSQIVTYYEALGYDTLVPNPNLAKFLNTKGEMEVGNEVIRITPKGTYRYPKGYEKEFEKFIADNPNETGVKISSDTYQLNEKIRLVRTFDNQGSLYSLVSKGNYVMLRNDYFDNDLDLDTVAVPMPLSASGIPEPNFNDFQIFSADHKTALGKLIQNIIGSTKTSTVNYNSKRRVRGQFYFYNYGVYGEIGVKGWTDKKMWYGWRKTTNDELRVGWKNIVLKSTLPSSYKNALKGVKDFAYLPPQYIYMNGVNVNAATVVMPDMPKSLLDKLVSQGVKAVYQHLKNLFGSKAKGLDNADACIIAVPDALYFVLENGNVVRYNEKSYCHVFAKNYMEFTIGWSNTNGFFLNNINQNNVGEIKTWIQAVINTFNQKKNTLVGGEVYVCARLGKEWRGMKIVKKVKM